jgi:alpha-1,3-glucosyltransferase
LLISHTVRASRQIVTILSILLQPSLILIDNGHFQYNSFPLAMTLLSVYLFQQGNDLLGAVAFSASLLFKQMGLYWSPAVFGYLLGKCIWLGGDEG